MRYEITLTPSALGMLKGIQDRRTQRAIANRIDRLAVDPEKQGRHLIGALARYRSVRAGGQRYRIIYTIDQDRVVVMVVAVGPRKEKDKRDIYALAERIVRLGLMQPRR